MLIHKCFQLLGLLDCLPWSQGVYDCDWLLWWLQYVLHGLPRYLWRTYCLLHTNVLSHHEMLRDVTRYHRERREFISNLVAIVVSCKRALFGRKAFKPERSHSSVTQQPIQTPSPHHLTVHVTRWPVRTRLPDLVEEYLKIRVFKDLRLNICFKIIVVL